MAGVSAVIGAVTSIATAEQADPYFNQPVVGEGEPAPSLTILPPVYSLEGFSVTVLFEAVNDPEVTTEVWQVISVAATPESTFNYSTTTTSVTITEQASPFGSAWYCLMDDYSYQTFNTDTAVRAATNPAYKALVSFNLVPPYQILKSHQFQVTIRETTSLTTQVVPFTFTETIYLNVPSFISRVQSLVAAGV
jgi:hypothetical protein